MECAALAQQVEHFLGKENENAEFSTVAALTPTYVLSNQRKLVFFICSFCVAWQQVLLL